MGINILNKYKIYKTVHVPSISYSNFIFSNCLPLIMIREMKKQSSNAYSINLSQTIEVRKFVHFY